MTPETPLTEVAAHLPRDAAANLDTLPSPIQIDVLTRVRSVIVYWENQRYIFDPIAYEGSLNALVAVSSPLIVEVYRLHGELAKLQSLHYGNILIPEERPDDS